MTSFVTIDDATAAQDKPATQSLIRALRDNPVAIAEDDATAPGVVGLNAETTLTASASSSLVFTGLSTDYDIWEIEIINLLLSSDTTLRLQVSLDGGSTWRTGSDYRYSYVEKDSPAGATPAAFIQLGSTITRTISGLIRMYTPAQNGGNKQFSWEGVHDIAGGVDTVQGGAIFFGSTSPITAVRLIPASGTITSGTAVLKVRRK